MADCSVIFRSHPRRRWSCWAVLWLALGLSPTGCGQVDPGEVELPRIRRLPDPRTYGLTIHPLLAGSCATAGCHGRPGPFTFRAAAEPLDPQLALGGPQDLPEPFRSGYFTVLGFCDLELPETSQLLRWGSGAERSHPGGQALDAAGQASVLAWLRSGGGAP